MTMIKIHLQTSGQDESGWDCKVFEDVDFLEFSKVRSEIIVYHSKNNIERIPLHPDDSIRIHVNHILKEFADKIVEKSGTG
jgi:hypothetical protein